MITSEDLFRGAARLDTAAGTAGVAADRIEQAAQRLANLLEDGYGGNGLRLIGLLEASNAGRDYKSELEALQSEVKASLDMNPAATRVFEGAGPENLAASLAVTMADAVRIRSLYTKAIQAGLIRREME